MSAKFRTCLFALICMSIWAINACKSRTDVDAKYKDSLKQERTVNDLNNAAQRINATRAGDKDSLVYCIQLLDSAIKMDKFNYVSYHNRSQAECRLGEYDKALEDINIVLKIRSDLSKEKVRKAFVLEKLNRKPEAMICYQDVINDYKQRLKMDSTVVEYYFSVAFATVLLKGTDSGVAIYEKALKKFPNNQRIISGITQLKSFDKDHFINSQVGSSLVR